MKKVWAKKESSEGSFRFPSFNAGYIRNLSSHSYSKYFVIFKYSLFDGEVNTSSQRFVKV